jgi:hypothetical protein
MTRLLLAVCAMVSGCAVGARPLPFEDAGVRSDLASFLIAPDLAGQQVTDLSGVDLAGVDLTGSTACTQLPTINEVQTGGSVSAADEFIELYWPCSQPGLAFALAGYKLAYRSASNTGTTDTTTLVTLSGSITANGFYLVVNSNGYSGTATPDQQYTYSGLAAAGGGVGLRNASGTLIDSVGWGTAVNPFVEGTAATAPAGGQSIARHPNGHDTNNNSTDFTVSTPTPKASN